MANPINNTNSINMCHKTDLRRLPRLPFLQLHLLVVLQCNLKHPPHLGHSNSFLTTLHMSQSQDSYAFEFLHQPPPHMLYMSCNLLQLSRGALGLVVLQHLVGHRSEDKPLAVAIVFAI